MTLLRRCASVRSLAALLALAAVGCARTAHLDVVRPAMINAAPFGNTFEVRPFEGDPEASAQLQSSLRARISGSLNRAIVLVQQNGGIAVQGSVLRHEYAETESREEARCSHTEQVNGRDAQVAHPCTRVVRRGEVRSMIEFTVVGVATGQVMFSRQYEGSRSAQSTGRVGPYPSDTIALAPLDHHGMMQASLEDTVSQFARVILPWTDSVELRFEGCDGDDRCAQGYSAVQAQRLDAAEALFTAVIGAEGAAVPPAQRERVGDAYYNRAMVRMIRGTYGGAFIDLQRAMELRPGRSEWTERYRELELLARDQEALRAQHGVTPESSGSDAPVATPANPASP